MTPESVMSLGRQGMEIMLMISAPILLVTLLIGLVIGIFQAATQINDASLSFVPKLVAVIAAFIIAGPWMLTIMTDYMRRLLTDLPGLIG
ncbi:MAG: flagellar biosynthesis protein FliQ [Hydrogenophilaceae bacterium]|nr:flagellar biosynthesis protein FliQ [Hydrogenophilaceae bacterium]